MAIEKMNEHQLNEVSGGTENAEPIMEWCEKCQKTTLHNEKGECMACKLDNTTARYRF